MKWLTWTIWQQCQKYKNKTNQTFELSSEFSSKFSSNFASEPLGWFPWTNGRFQISFPSATCSFRNWTVLHTLGDSPFHNLWQIWLWHNRKSTCQWTLKYWLLYTRQSLQLCTLVSSRNRQFASSWLQVAIWINRTWSPQRTRYVRGPFTWVIRPGTCLSTPRLQLRTRTRLFNLNSWCLTLPSSWYCFCFNCCSSTALLSLGFRSVKQFLICLPKKNCAGDCPVTV